MKNLSILLIEDDMIEVMKLGRAQKTLQLNHMIIEANNGEEALQILEDKSKLPDIILLDLNMPKINGIEFLRILKSDDQLDIYLLSYSLHRVINAIYWNVIKLELQAMY